MEFATLVVKLMAALLGLAKAAVGLLSEAQGRAKKKGRKH